jgi:hypothetical protein
MPPAPANADTMTPDGAAPELRYPVPMPGAFAEGTPGPVSTVNVQMRNELDEGEMQSRMDRMAAESRGWDGIYAASGVPVNGQRPAV